LSFKFGITFAKLLVVRKTPVFRKELLLCFVLLGLAVEAVFGETSRCTICSAMVSKARPFFGITGEQRMVCSRCASEPHCAICWLPIRKGEAKQLDDGRTICTDDFNAGVFSQTELDEIARETRRELERTFYRFGMGFSGTNVTISLVPANRLYAKAQLPYNPTSVNIGGFTEPIFLDERGVPMRPADVYNGTEPSRVDYEIFLVSGLPRARLMAVCAHELSHVWQGENLHRDRAYRLEAKTREAFCELVAYQLMSALQQPFEKAVIKANLYTAGQSELLMEIENDYGFNRILEWMKNGQDLNLSRAELDRVRLVDIKPTEIIAAPPLFKNAAPIEVPNRLILKGILGSGSKKMALINNQSFFALETSKVKVGVSNVLVKVIEIRDTSVVVQTNGATNTEEIFLTK
jgi:hypothetical protein